MKLTHFSLFTGIGGIDIAAEQAGFTTVGQCEYADYPTKVLNKHWPNVPRWRDIRDVTAESFRERTGLHTIDLISGGFPCQPFSVAGKQKGKGDDRYLWPEMLRVIREFKPRWVLGENVPGILRIAADDVCKDLEREGYDVGIFDFEAAAVGAPHRRERIFFVANAGHGGRDKQDNASKLSRGANVKRTGEIIPDTESKQNRRLYQPGLQSDIRTSGDVADTHNEGLERRHEYCSAVSRENERFQSWTESGGTKFISRSGEIVADSEVNRLQRDWAGREQITDSRCEKGQFERLCNGLHASDTDGSREQQPEGLQPKIWGWTCDSSRWQLNPTWVEWLMGFPSGWTEL